MLQKYDEIIGERNESFRKRDEENQRFWKRIREEDYYERRKSEPRLIIPDLSNDTYAEKQMIEIEESMAMKIQTELIPKQNYNSNRRKFRNYDGKRKKKRSEPQIR
jgi:hypothetical protein